MYTLLIKSFPWPTGEDFGLRGITEQGLSWPQVPTTPGAQQWERWKQESKVLSSTFLRLLPNPPFMVSPVNFFSSYLFWVSTLVLLLPSQPHRVEKPQVSVARKPEFGFHHLLSVGSWASHTNLLCFGFFICPMGIGCNLLCYVWCVHHPGRWSLAVHEYNIGWHPLHETIDAKAFEGSYERERYLIMHNS